MGIRRLRKIIVSITIFSVLFSCGCPTFAKKIDDSASEQQLIYVSGCPDCAPIEYYDSDENMYLGYIPLLLESFSDSTDYEVEYLSPSSSDERKEKLKNLQVELVSCCTEDDLFTDEQWDNALTVLKTEVDGETIEYRILFTDIASDELVNEFTSFVNSVTPAQSSGMLLQASDVNSTGIPILYFVIICSVAAVLLIGVIIVFVFGRKRKKQMELNKGTDSLTGIGNYLYMSTYYKQFVNDKNRSLYSAVYFYVDTSLLEGDNTERLNVYLRHIALLLDGNIADTDISSKVDEYGFCVMKTTSSIMAADVWTDNILKQIDAYQDEPDALENVTVYAGIYPLHTHDRDLDEIILKANRSALYAKKNNLRFDMSSRRHIESGGENDELRNHLESAFKNDEFAIYLQFITEATGKKIIGAEALSRWNHPQKGILLPQKFIHLCESEKMIDVLDFNSFRKTCEYLENIHKDIDCDFFISCNFSRHTIILPDFAERFNAVLEEFTFPRSCLILEITEYSRIDDVEIMYDNIRSVRQSGIGVLIDDFGNGYSDLQDLGKYSYDGIKIDKSLVAGNHTQSDDIILRNIITTASDLDMVVIAEGVETYEQAQRLSDMGCVLMQGYYFYYPMPLLEAKRVFREQKIISCSKHQSRIDSMSN